MAKQAKPKNPLFLHLKKGMSNYDCSDGGKRKIGIPPIKGLADSLRKKGMVTTETINFGRSS